MRISHRKWQKKESRQSRGSNIMKYFSVFNFVVIFFILSCGVTTNKNPSASAGVKINSVKDSIVIIIQPFDDIDDSLTKYIFAKFKEIIPSVELKKPVSILQNAYYKPRNRYKADSLLNFLGKLAHENEVYIGLTSKDISTTNGNIPDWGVMGLGFCPGNACVVSTYRLKKNNLKDQLFKVAIHEVGHTQGLDHCPNAYCIMRDAKGKNTTDDEKDFCPNCKTFLINKGWKFN